MLEFRIQEKLFKCCITLFQHGDLRAWEYDRQTRTDACRADLEQVSLNREKGGTGKEWVMGGLTFWWGRQVHMYSDGLEGDP